ncbi:MAG: MerC domain-containing protein [Myxococcota bacterium]
MDTHRGKGHRAKPWLDWLGAFASAACATHCVAVALAPAVFAVIGLEFLADESAEWAFVATVAVTAGLAAWAGYRVHRSRRIALGFAAGLSLLLLSRLLEEWGLGHEMGVVVGLAAGLVLIGSHFTSLRRCRACDQSAA